MNWKDKKKKIVYWHGEMGGRDVNKQILNCVTGRNIINIYHIQYIKRLIKKVIF